MRTILPDEVIDMLNTMRLAKAYHDAFQHKFRHDEHTNKYIENQAVANLISHVALPELADKVHKSLTEFVGNGGLKKALMTYKMHYYNNGYFVLEFVDDFFNKAIKAGGTRGLSGFNGEIIVDFEISKRIIFSYRNMYEDDKIVQIKFKTRMEMLNCIKKHGFVVDNLKFLYGDK